MKYLLSKLTERAAVATSSTVPSTSPPTITPLTYDDVVSHFMSLDLTEQKVRYSFAINIKIIYNYILTKY